MRTRQLCPERSRHGRRKENEAKKYSDSVCTALCVGTPSGLQSVAFESSLEFRKEDSMPRCHVLALVSLLCALCFLASCQSGHSADELYILVSANIQVPYWKTAA